MRENATTETSGRYNAAGEYELLEGGRLVGTFDSALSAYRWLAERTNPADTPQEETMPARDDQCAEHLSAMCSHPWGAEEETVTTEETTIDRAIAYAGKLGAEHGAMAANRVEIADAGQARKILAGIDDVDPEVMDWLPAADLSGQWADGLSATDLYNAVSDHLELGETDDDTYHALRDAICDAFEGEYASAVEYVVAETCRRMLEAS